MKKKGERKKYELYHREDRRGSRRERAKGKYKDFAGEGQMWG